MTMTVEIRLSNDHGPCTEWIEADMTLVGLGLIKVEAVTPWHRLREKPTQSEVRFAGQVVIQSLGKKNMDELWPRNHLGTMTLSLPMSIKIEADPSLELPAWTTM